MADEAASDIEQQEADGAVREIGWLRHEWSALLNSPMTYRPESGREHDLDRAVTAGDRDRDGVAVSPQQEIGGGAAEPQVAKSYLIDPRRQDRTRQVDLARPRVERHAERGAQHREHRGR